MTTFVCLYLAWAFSAAMSVFIMVDRGVTPNIMTLFIILCPVLNTLYVIYRFKYILPFVKEIFLAGIKDSWKKL